MDSVKAHAYPRSAAPLSSNPCPVTRVFTGRFLFNRSCQSRHCLRAECTIYLGAQLIERVSQGQTLAGVLLILIAYVLLSGFEEAMHALSSCMLDTLKDRLRMKIKRDVNHFVSNYPDMGI